MKPLQPKASSDQNINSANKSSKSRKRKSSNNYQSIKPIPDSQVESKEKTDEKNDGLLRGNNLNQTKETSNGLIDGQSFQDFDDEDPIPEISLSDQEENGNFVGSDNQVQEEEEEEDDDESEYPSDDVDDAELGSLLDDSTDDDDSPQELDTLIARSSSKPIEVDSKIASDPTFIPKKDTGFMSRARSKPSAFVQGVKINVWDDIEPGYGSESSTEEVSNRIGNIPAHFYDDMPHIGYDINGQKILRPAKGDELDKFLAGIEDPSSWTSVQDKLLQKDVKLTDEELEIIHKLAKAENPDAEFDPYEPTVEFFTGKDKQMNMPLSGKPEPKRRFIPSKWEHKKVMKIVRAIRQGRIVPNKLKVEKPQFYGIWSSEDQPRAMGPMYMPAPKLKLPSHIESYNPPAEYLFDEDERKAWEQADPSDRKIDFIPAKHPSLRLVPAYSDFVQQRFDRCLDLYLAPRMLRRRPKLDISDPSELLPKLPSPKDLRPFPSVCAIKYIHENGTRIRTLSIDPSGMWVATGSDDGQVRVWECKVGRCAFKWNLGINDSKPVYSLEWCPDPRKCLLSAVVSGTIYLLCPLGVISPALAEDTINAVHMGFTTATDGPTVSAAKWARAAQADRDRGVLVEVAVPGVPKQVTWHKRGDYFASVAPDAGSQSVLIHQLSRHQTQSPFRKSKGTIQKVAFHPIKPYLFVATQQYIRLYDLMAQTLIKTLQPGVRWISSLDVHPMGDNVIVGSYDKRLVWHDMDLSERPFKTLRYHEKAIRSVAFSTKFPLFFSASDDGTIQIFHSTVYSDLMMNPLIVPLKVLKGHVVTNSLGVLEAKWHPTEPWVVSVGADGVGRLWCA